MEAIKMIEWFDERWYRIKLDENDSIFVPSVTTKLGIVSKPFLARWRGDIGNREADMRLFESSERGIRIHHAWYTICTGGTVVYQPWQRPNYDEAELKKMYDDNACNLAILRYQDEYYDVFKLAQWLEIVKPNIIGCEKMVYKLRYDDDGKVLPLASDAGTLDNVFHIEAGEYSINGKKPLGLPKGRYVIDLKTGKSTDENHDLQVAKYADCEDSEEHPIQGTLILHTGSSVKSGIAGLSTQFRNRDEWQEDLKNYELASKLWQSRNTDAMPKVFEFPASLSVKGLYNGKNIE